MNKLGRLSMMTWEPITSTELKLMLSRDLAECSEAQRENFGKRIQPAKWRLSPWGDLGGGF